MLVTGGCGYIGSHLTTRLVQDGYDVTVLDNMSVPWAKRPPDEVKFYFEDLSGIVEYDGAPVPLCVARILRKHQIDAVIHLAATASVGAGAAPCFQNNVAGTINLLEAMQEAKVNKLIFASSAAVYGDPKGFIIGPYTKGMQPLSAYGESKLMCEGMLKYFPEIKSSIFRLFNVAGGADGGNHLIPTLIRCARSGKPFTLNGIDYPDSRDGTCTRDYIHVEDVVERFIGQLRAWDTSFDNSRGVTLDNICSGFNCTNKEVLHSVEKFMGISIATLEGHRRPSEPAFLVGGHRVKQRTANQEYFDTIVKSAVEHTP